MTTRIHHPTCPARDGTRNNLDACICRDGIPVVDLTEAVQSMYRQADKMRALRLHLIELGNQALDAADAFERLAAVLDGSSTTGDEPRPWNGTQP